MTDIEKNVLEAIIDFKAEHEYSPTVREICVMTDKAVATVADVLKKLEANGYISTDNYKARTIKVIKPITNYDRIKNMSVREMSEFFATNKFPDFPSSPCDICEYDEGGMYCLKTIPCTHADKVANYGKWLESEVTEKEGVSND